MYKYATSSILRLKQVDKDLRAVFILAKQRAEIDFDISCGHRSIKKQAKLFKAGKSQLDGVHHKSKHNYLPALAVDIYAYNGRRADYSKDKMDYLSKVIFAAADELGIKIEWGGNWKDFIDAPHYEL